MKTYSTPEEATSVIHSGQRVFIHGGAMTPIILIRALCNRYEELQQVELIHLHTEGDAPYTHEKYHKSFRINSCFVASNVRNAVNNDNGDYIPVFLSEVPALFKKNILPLDVAILQVSAPDAHGYCSLGASVDVALAAADSAKVIIAEINELAPRVHGSGFIHISKIDHAVHVKRPLFEQEPGELCETDKQIGRHIASLIEDGSTLQMGIGSVPDAVLAELGSHRRLGIHTEMFSDGVIPLVEKGVITGEDKKIGHKKMTACFVLGSNRLYDFVNDHPGIQLRSAAYTNDTSIIRMNPRVVAINSAIEVDLTGQVCADSIGTYQYSGVGGQMDFIRGASLSEGGKAIIALHSTTSKGLSKINPFLKPGASVTTTRAHVQYIVTEYGIADLYGKNLRQRAKALISIAHPDHREALEKEAMLRFHYL